MARILVLTRSYPSSEELYRYPFVHRRVVAYAKAGHDVAVFRAGTGELSSHEFDGVTCWSGGDAALRSFAERWKPGVIAAHGFSETMWQCVEAIASEVPVRAWLHGSEIPDFMRQKAMVAPEDERPAALDALAARCSFWEALLAAWPAKLRLVFVSHAAVDLARKDWGERLAPAMFSVLPNPIDTDLFSYEPKPAEQRFRILLIRPFDSRTYANDLAVEAVQKLLDSSHGSQLRFTIIGDGPLFDETLKRLHGVSSVDVQRGFLRQEEIVAQHREHGLFLVPTRLDTQGVSRDEAMASGLVPVTNSIAAVREFVDERCAALAPPDDSDALAERIAEMIEDPVLFLRRSEAAAEHIRATRSNSLIIPRELALLEEAASG